MRFMQTVTNVQLDLVRILLREYHASIGVDLCFQDFDKEVIELPGEDAQPSG